MKLLTRPTRISYLFWFTLPKKDNCIEEIEKKKQRCKDFETNPFGHNKNSFGVRLHGHIEGLYSNFVNKPIGI